MDNQISLVKKGDLEQVLNEQIQKNQIIVDDVEKILPYVKDESLMKALAKRCREAQERLGALKAGYIPIASNPIGFFFITDKAEKGEKPKGTSEWTPTQWNQLQAAESFETMPAEVKEVYERVKASGIFGKMGITEKRAGDPVLAGRAGGQWFFIAAWVNIVGDKAIGFMVRNQ